MKNQITKCGNFYTLRKMDVSHKESDYAKRNAGDLSTQPPTVEEYNAANQMDMAHLFATTNGQCKNSPSQNGEDRKITNLLGRK